MDFSLLFSSVGDLHRQIHLERKSDQPPQRAEGVSLLHLVNPVGRELPDPLARAQILTFASMRTSRDHSLSLSPEIAVDFAACALTEDAWAIPNDFVRLRDLERTSRDVHEFGTPRDLPLLFDILGRGIERAKEASAPRRSFLIYTNVDITLAPHFYAYCGWLIGRGFDAVVINRRSIANSYDIDADLPAMLSDFGQVHPGFDCFVFDTALFERFIPFESVLGMGAVMRALLFNLLAVANRPVIVTDAHATYHLGIDAEWRNPKYGDYIRFNRKEASKVITAHCESNQEMRKRFDSLFSTAPISPPPGTPGFEHPVLPLWRRIGRAIGNKLKR